MSRAIVTLDRIQALADGIASRFRPERIVLFGSHADGTASGESDVDILVVMRQPDRPWQKAAEIRTAVGADFPLDLIVRDPDLLRWRIDNEDWFLREVMARGKVLYEAIDRRVAA